MALVDGDRSQLSADSGSGPGNTLTDAEKNQNAANAIRAQLAKSALVMRNALVNIARMIAEAPGTKAEIMALLGVDEAESNTIAAAMVPLANAHKSQVGDDPDNPAPVADVSF